MPSAGGLTCKQLLPLAIPLGPALLGLLGLPLPRPLLLQQGLLQLAHLHPQPVLLALGLLQLGPQGPHKLAEARQVFALLSRPEAHSGGRQRPVPHAAPYQLLEAAQRRGQVLALTQVDEHLAHLPQAALDTGARVTGHQGRLHSLGVDAPRVHGRPAWTLQRDADGEAVPLWAGLGQTWHWGGRLDELGGYQFRAPSWLALGCGLGGEGLSLVCPFLWSGKERGSR